MSQQIMAMDSTEEEFEELEPLEEPNSKRRLMLIALVGVAAFVVAFLIATLLGGNDDPTSLPQAQAPGAAAKAPAAPAASPVPSLRTYTGATGRDPFLPLPTPEASKPAAPVASTAPSAPAAPVAVAGGSTGTGPTLKLTKIAASQTGMSATLVVDGKSYVAKEGQTFAKTFKIYQIFNNECLGMLYGDQNIAICVGDTQSL